ncbi:hypothetical protein SAMN04487948_11829 [Halogranum amylolyticum]|uniref:Uncharacterized protein n=1 Tax=Halogranum amylolyticum TaxID=660520 RepID=A0A1H8VNN8_9EURY|nr:hypothetical protein SAMN04487948_11829 [Halogranum amylolyticum]
MKILRNSSVQLYKCVPTRVIRTWCGNSFDKFLCSDSMNWWLLPYNSSYVRLNGDSVVQAAVKVYE